MPGDFLAACFHFPSPHVTYFCLTNDFLTYTCHNKLSILANWSAMLDWRAIIVTQL